jgi:hypothetical protein
MYHCTQVVVLKLDIDQLLGFSQQSNKVRYRNPTLAKCGGEAQHLEKLGSWSPSGLPNVQSSTSRGKTPRIEVFLVSLKRS